MNFLIKFKKYIYTFLLGLLLVFIICISKEIYHLKSIHDIYKVLSDACSVPGVLFLGLGLLLFVTNEGLFNGFSYSAKRIFHGLQGKSDFDEEFYKYNERQKSKRISFSHLIIVGILYLVVSLFFAFMFSL